MASELHTSLEIFLLFRYLQSLEEGAPSFVEVSNKLKQDDILRLSQSFELSRLEPDALQNVYLRILKEEAKAQAQIQVEGRGDQDSQASINPRKRKFSSPRLETLEEAGQYAHLVPQLVDRLYFHYQRDAVEAIQKEEQILKSLESRTDETKRGEREGRQPNSESTSRPSSHGVPSIQTLLRHEDESNTHGQGASRPVNQNGGYYLESSSVVANGTPVPARPSVGSDTRIPSNDPRYVQPGGYRPMSSENGPPYLPPLQHPTQSYPLSTPGQDTQMRRPSQPMPSPSPRMGQGSLPPPERSSASPIILPPVSGMLRSQASPTGPLDPVGESGPPYRSGPTMSPRVGQSAVARPPSNPLPPPRNYAQPPYSYHNGSQYSPYPYNQQGYYHQYPNGPNNVSQGAPYTAVPAYSPHVPPHPPQNTGYYPSPGYYNQPAGSTPYAQQQPPRYVGQQTPVSDGRFRPAPPLSVNTSASSTKWKHVELGRGVKLPDSPNRPVSREVSPISDRDDTPEQDATPVPKDSTSTQEKLESATKSAKPNSTRGGRSRGRGRGRGGRVSSASVSARGPTRSPSVASHTDELSIDPKPSVARNIKHEPSATSTHDDEASTMDESSRKLGRGRRGTIRDDEAPAIPRTTTKRKRGDSNLALMSPSLRPFSGAAVLTPRAKTFSRPGYVLATRNFNKISTTLMQSITGHKDAYLFAKPLTERDAPGYDKLIFRPQDLKGIKAALTAGSKAVTAMADEAGEEVSAGAKCIWVPKTEDVVPPNGIVNSAQLEKELLRIFANAVMFNPDLAENRGLGLSFQRRARTLEEREAGGKDDDGTEAEKFEIGVAQPVDGAVVKDTRDMCADMEEAFDGWRELGKVDEADARDAPVVTNSDADEEGNDQVTGGGEQGGEADEDDELAGGNEAEQEKEASAEPRPKRRRRQL